MKLKELSYGIIYKVIKYRYQSISTLRIFEFCWRQVSKTGQHQIAPTYPAMKYEFDIIDPIIENHLYALLIQCLLKPQLFGNLELLTDHNNRQYLPQQISLENAMKQASNDSDSNELLSQEESSLHNDKIKKSSYSLSRRILKDHDLDRLLIYQKRDGRKARDFYECWAHKEAEIAELKRARKKQRLLIKKQNKMNRYQQLKSKDQSPQAIIPSLDELFKTQKQSFLNETQQKKLIPSKRTAYKSRQEQNLSYVNTFPIPNTYISEHLEEHLEIFDAMGIEKQKLDKQKHQKLHTSQGTILNCDVKYFNWNHFIEEVGKFDVLIIDPPWRIKGAQKNDSQFMFSNCRFSLQYNTMSNHEIKTLPLHLISDQGFIFLWILNTQLNSSLEIMQSWGYQLVEEIVWVKLRNQKIYLTHGYYFMHSYQICLIGYKNTKKIENGQNMEVRHGLNHNVIFAEVRKKSQKPDDLYHLIEMIFKGKKKLEIFARNHNVRFGIFSIGNQLGTVYDKWTLHLKCDSCKCEISHRSKRYKSKIKANFDLCQKCAQSHNKDFFFELSNEADQDVRHQFLTCNLCGIEPIWGNRFQCLTCEDYDLCQNCFDRYLATKTDTQILEKIHPNEHQFRVLQVPVFGNGFAIHEHRCGSCYQSPILGVCFSCLTCKNFKLCQKCFFERPRQGKRNFSKTHRAGHGFEIFFDPIAVQKHYQCFRCKILITQNCWSCENCHNFFFCQYCYETKDQFKSLHANSHKKYHAFRLIF